MKRVMIFLFCMMGVVTELLAQDVTYTIPAGKYFYSDSLKTTHDTVDVVTTAVQNVTYWSITAWTDSGTDTVVVYTRSPANGQWVQHGLVDLSSNTDVTQVIATTTPKEFLLLDVFPIKIRAYSPGTTSIITRFTIGGKRQGY